MSVDPKDLIISLAATFQAEGEAAHDLWTWLPSHHIMGGRGNTPSPSALMYEAASLFAILKNPRDPDSVQANLRDIRDGVYDLSESPTTVTLDDVRNAIVAMGYLPPSE